MELRAYDLYDGMLEQTHLLVAGATGSGKSVVVNGIIYNGVFNSPHDFQMILIDPKRVELVSWRYMPHTLRYASEPEEMVEALRYAIEETEKRYKLMQRRGIKKYDGGHIYVIIDELADLMTTNKKEVMPVLQRLAQIGRAANVHIVAATQCPLASIIPTAIKVNFDSRVGLRTRSAQDSRNILGEKGCEKLPRYGYAWYMTAEGTELVEVPLYSEEVLDNMVNYWTQRRTA